MSFVYIVSNPSFPQYVKIGYTNNLEKRRETLFNTSVPHQFVLEFFVEDVSAKYIEKETHRLLKNKRVVSNREFFKCSVEEAKLTITEAQKVINDNLVGLNVSNEYQGMDQDVEKIFQILLERHEKMNFLTIPATMLNPKEKSILEANGRIHEINNEWCSILKKSGHENQEDTDLKNKFWANCSHLSLNDRQRKVLNKILDVGPEGFVGGINNSKYSSMGQTSRATATRDLAELNDWGLLVADGGGRSRTYRLNWGALMTPQAKPKSMTP